MYQHGQMVVYGSHGVCKLIDIETRNVDKKDVEYYALEPTSQQGTRFYVPVHNKAVAGKLRNLLSREQWNALIADTMLHFDAWVPDENRRVAQYREIINRADPRELMTIVRPLRNHREKQIAAGRKFHISDATILKNAESLRRTSVCYGCRLQ